jgi:hypothetical protein
LYKNDIAKGCNANNLINAVTKLQEPEEESFSNDNDEHEEVFTLGRMNTRSQTRVNRYYTQEEVNIESQLAETQRVEEERLEGPWHHIDSSESGSNDVDDMEPKYDDDDDDEFDNSVQGDQDVADESIE